MGINLQATDPAQAAREWTLRFERPANAQLRAQERAAVAHSYMGGGGGATPPGGGTPPAPLAPGVPPPGVGAALSYYNNLYSRFNTQLGLSAALTQSQVDYQRRQQGFANQLAGYQSQGLDLTRQQAELENRYQNDVAFLNQRLNRSTQLTNEKKWRQIATNIAALQKLGAQGLAQDKAYTTKAKNLEKAIHGATQRWIGQQKGFNQRDFALAKQALNNVLTTEAARWTEIQRLTGTERNLAKQKQSFIAKGAEETYGQALAEAQFVEKEQLREARSEAISKGAVLSRGFAEDVGAFGEQRGLAGSAAQVSRDDVLRMSRNQLAGELEDINQAYRQGRISYQDVQRQTANAKQRAALTFQQTAARLGFEGQQARFDFQGNYMDLNKRWDDSILAYQHRRQELGHQREIDRLDYLGKRADLLAQQQHSARTQAFNNAFHGLNLAQYANTGGGYAAELARQQASTSNQMNQVLIGGAQDVAGINQQRAAADYGLVDTVGSYAGQPPAGYRSPTTSRQRAGARYNPSATTSRSAGVYAPPMSAYN
jgi:hypothetical protein